MATAVLSAASVVDVLAAARFSGYLLSTLGAWTRVKLEGGTAAVLLVVGDVVDPPVVLSEPLLLRRTTSSTITITPRMEAPR